jgi:predicted thioesterase
MIKPRIVLAALESRLHEVNAIKTGIKLFKGGKVAFHYNETLGYIADVDDKGSSRRCTFHFTHDGQDIKEFSCPCSTALGGALCKHIIAGVLAVQGGLPETNLVLGKTATISTTVSESNTAIAMKSGSLPVFATPSMVALMEQAACECLSDCLEDGQTSVGISLNIEHTAASMMNRVISATATIDFVFGRKIEFTVTAWDDYGEIGKGKHTRMIVDAERFLGKGGKATKIIGGVLLVWILT